MEDKSVKDDYKVIAEFVCCGKPMVTVMLGNAAHVMSQEEWNKFYSIEHKDKYLRFNEGYRKSKVS